MNINLGGTTSSAIGTGTFTISAEPPSITPAAVWSLGTNNLQSWNGNFTFNGTNALNLGSGNVTLGSSLSLTANGNITVPLTVGGIIADGGHAYSLTKAGTGDLVLSGANTYTGGTILNAGTLTLNNAAALGTGPLTINGGLLDSTSPSAITLSTNNPQTWNGNFTFTGTQSLNLGTGAVTLGNNIQVTVSANTLTVGGAVSGSGLGLTLNGAGTLVLNTNELYTGPTVINGGILQVNGTNSPTAGINSSGFVTVNSGGTLMTGGTDNGLGGNGTLTVTINAGGTLTSPSGATTTNHLKTLNLYGGTLGFAGTIAGSALTYGPYNLDLGLTAGGLTAAATSTITRRISHSHRPAARFSTSTPPPLKLSPASTWMSPAISVSPRALPIPDSSCRVQA